MTARKHIIQVLFYVIVAITMLITLWPFALMITGSLKTQTEMNRYPLRLIPREPTLANYRILFERIPYWRQFANSSFVAVTAALLAMFFNGMVSYGFSRFQFKGKNILFGFILATMMIPGQVFMVPLFILNRRLGLYGTYGPLIIPSICTAGGIFLIRQVMSQVPSDLYESAVIDGCPEIRIYAQIAVPLSASAFGIHGVLTFMGCWNDFMTPLIYLTSDARATLPLGLMRLEDYYNVDYGTPLAGAFLSCLPVLLILTLFGQKYFVNGLMVGAVKG